MFLFRRRSRKLAEEAAEATLQYFADELLDMDVDMRHNQIAEESMKILQTTLNPSTFFGRCDDIVKAEERITGESSMFRRDVKQLTTLQVDFMKRVVAAGRGETLQEAMKPYIGRLTDAALMYYRHFVETK